MIYRTWLNIRFFCNKRKWIFVCNNIEGNSGDDWDYTNDSSNWSRPANTANMTSGGQYCWCMPTTWTPNNGSTIPLSSSWFYVEDPNIPSFMPSACESTCATACGSIFNYAVSSGGIGISGLVGAQASTCNANTITINWGDAAGGTHATNTCTYDGALQTPTTAPTKRGHTFTGWTFGSHN